MRIVVVLLALLAAVPVHAGGFRSREQLGMWIEHYYVHPEPGRVADALACMRHSGLLADESEVMPIAGFLSGVFRSNPGRVDAWVASTRGMSDAQSTGVLLGVRFAGLEDPGAPLRELVRLHPGLAPSVAQLDSVAAATIEDLPIGADAAQLDALWGRFLATGDAAPVERVIAALPLATDSSHVGRAIVGQAARWSLQSNAVEHARVMEICEASAREHPDDAALREVIAEARDELSKAKRGR